ncbi:MAG: DUF3576 domain-containing protein [Brevundimonas sp.]|uniref:DUF3576 domain-containing protein n=1 Tax=Brevundimonas sp. TaxID=1871086 RepID=UPI00391DC085
MAITRGVSIALIASSVALASCGGLNPFSRGGGGTASAGAEQGIGVNSFLWRASLDTLSFMPLITADPWGGVINYDWHTPAASPGERFKATVFILDTRLRADALNVTVTREVRNEAGQWIAQPVNPQTETDLENAILTRARQLNLAHAG